MVMRPVGWVDKICHEGWSEIFWQHREWIQTQSTPIQLTCNIMWRWCCSSFPPIIIINSIFFLFLFFTAALIRYLRVSRYGETCLGNQQNVCLFWLHWVSVYTRNIGNTPSHQNALYIIPVDSCNHVCCISLHSYIVHVLFFLN